MGRGQFARLRGGRLAASYDGLELGGAPPQDAVDLSAPIGEPSTLNDGSESPSRLSKPASTGFDTTCVSAAADRAGASARCGLGRLSPRRCQQLAGIIRAWGGQGIPQRGIF